MYGYWRLARKRRLTADMVISSLGPGRYVTDRSSVSPHVCPACRHRLSLVRRRTSPPRLGPPLVTEFYRCDVCDDGYVFSPSTHRWKPWSGDEW